MEDVLTWTLFTPNLGQTHKVVHAHDGSAYFGSIIERVPFDRNGRKKSNARPWQVFVDGVLVGSYATLENAQGKLRTLCRARSGE